MIDNSLKERFPFAYNYFSKMLELKNEQRRNFPQGLIFEGEDTIGQYVFALELARILNCKENGAPDCQCTNCKWIRNFEHPSITNVSQIHFKGEDDDSKTVISVKQAREIEKNLIMSSDYHRFFIFFSSSELKEEKDILKDFYDLGYRTNLNFTIEPINLKTFHPTTPNALLKSLEEPPLNTTFVFLTNSRENILSTIVSRCQVFKLSGKKQKVDFEEISNIFSNYPNIDYPKALDIVENLLELEKTKELRAENIFDKILEFLKELLKQNLNNSFLILKIKKDINTIKKAQKMTKANVQDKIAFEYMMLKIAKGS